LNRNEFSTFGIELKSSPFSLSFLDVEVWCFSGAWCLELGASPCSTENIGEVSNSLALRRKCAIIGAVLVTNDILLSFRMINLQTVRRL
jgi:hypothetical protein